MAGALAGERLPFMVRFACSWLAIAWAVSALGLAQEVSPAGAGERRAAVADAVHLWVEDYQAGRVAPGGPLRQDAGLQPRYAIRARAADLLAAGELGALTHLEALQKLLYYAETDPDEAVGNAVLEVASAGFDKSLVDRDAVVLRDLGHWVLMRVEHRGVWFLLMRAASGERVPFLVDAQEQPPTDAARRVAALKLLGMKGWPIFRGTIESALSDVDARVRLAAVEAIEFQRRPESLSVLTRLLGVERHPIVAQAVVHATRAALEAGRTTLPAEVRDRAVRAAMHAFGQAGWRADMDLLDFVETFPHVSAVPPLIEVLDRQAQPTSLEAVVNRSASPLLKRRAHECLRGLTGAILPIDQPEEWRAFWGREQHNIVVPAQLPRQRAAGNTASSFFGIPVTGREIAFVIDTSGSMDEAFAGTVARRNGRRDPRQASRLDAAKEQLLLAVQVMPPESRYHVLTFADHVQDWSRKAVPPTPAATRSLIELLTRFQAQGGTNVYEGLVQALALDELFFGQEGRKSIDELFLLSDGEPTEGPVKDPEEILRLVKQANRYLHVRINTVFAGTGKGADFLRRLAEENDGVYVQR